jgi:hypothetical protein
MPLSRRRLISAAAAVPIFFVARQGLSVIGNGLSAAAAAARPSADGTSDTRCAQCGSPDHTMLDPQCPLAPRVLA